MIAGVIKFFATTPWWVWLIVFLLLGLRRKAVRREPAAG